MGIPKSFRSNTPNKKREILVIRFIFDATTEDDALNAHFEF